MTLYSLFNKNILQNVRALYQMIAPWRGYKL